MQVPSSIFVATPSVSSYFTTRWCLSKMAWLSHLTLSHTATKLNSTCLIDVNSYERDSCCWNAELLRLNQTSMAEGWTYQVF